MPELPEIETIKNGIAGFIGNAEVLDVKIYNRHLRETISEDIASKLIKARINTYQRIGKYIILNLDNNYSILWHMGMSGHIKTFKTCPETLEKHDHIILTTNAGCLVYNDPRRFGLFLCMPTNQIGKSKYLAKIGIDPFSPNFKADILEKKLKQKKVPVKVALLDQAIITGIGNIYASEILYAAKISPFRSANEISFEECESLVKNTKIILQKAIDNGGSTLHDYHKPDGSLGYFQNLHCVYGKSGQRCPECTCQTEKTGGIQKETTAGRSTFYCPVLQK